MTAVSQLTDLDVLAQWVAERLELGDERSAWEVTVALEEAAGLDPDAADQPPSPIIARRFARAHTLMVERGVDQLRLPALAA